MFELLGLVVVKILGHGWLWHRGEHIDADEVYGNGCDLLFIGLATAVSPILIVCVWALLMPFLFWLGWVDYCTPSGMCQ